MNKSVLIGKKSYGHVIVICAGVLALSTIFLFSLSIGAVPISVGEIFQIIFSKIVGDTFVDNDVQHLVLLNIRLPRIVFTVMVGAALGISGASLQGLFRNPLVEPGIIGVSSGAALGAVTVILGSKLLNPAIAEFFGVWLLPVFSFAGAILATLITLRLGSFEGKTVITILILTGVAITALAGAAIGLAIFYADEQQLRTYSFWTLGDLSVATWQKNLMLAPFAIFTVLGLGFMGKPLNALALGEAEAFHSGVNVERLKVMIIILCSLAVGTSVAFAGMIGFVGLVVPHIVRIAFSADHTLVLPLSAIGGSWLLLIADMIGRTVVAPAELPIGIITAAIGTPFFLYLLMSNKKKRIF